MFGSKILHYSHLIYYIRSCWPGPCFTWMFGISGGSVSSTLIMAGASGILSFLFNDKLTWIELFSEMFLKGRIMWFNFNRVKWNCWKISIQINKNCSHNFRPLRKIYKLYVSVSSSPLNNLFITPLNYCLLSYRINIGFEKILWKERRIYYKIVPEN